MSASTYCPSCGKAGVVVGLDCALRETRPVVRTHACGVGGPGSTPEAGAFDPNGILTCQAEAITWGRCTLLQGHAGWHRADYDGGRRWHS